MSVKIIGNDPGNIAGGAPFPLNYPATFVTPIIEVAGKTWPVSGGSWVLDPDLTLVSCTVTIKGVDQLQMQRRYGTDPLGVKMPFETQFKDRKPYDLIGHWVRLKIMGPKGYLVQFVGRIESQPRTLTGSATSPAGMQTFVASGALRWLQKISVSTSKWKNADTSLSAVGWIPPMNQRDHRGLLTGNRSDAADAGTGIYYYGGTSVWTHRQYLEYVVATFANGNGPTWTIGGQAALLDGMKTTIHFGDSMPLAHVIAKLIAPEYGVDFRVTPTAAGFEITVFALSDKASVFAGATTPKNKNTVIINRSTQMDLVSTHVVDTCERRYDRVEIVGKRITVCGTLWGKGKSEGNLDPANGTPSAQPERAPKGKATLVPRWGGPPLEADYIAAVGSAVDSEQDQVRKNIIYRDVYEHYGAPDDWDLDNGVWGVATKDDGSLTTGDVQNVVRATLSHLPLKEGFDYTMVPPTDKTAGGDAEYMACTAWIYNELGLQVKPTDGFSPRYIECNTNGLGVGIPHLDWGVFMHASPNHKLALNHWTAAQINSTTDGSEPLYDYDTLLATIAIESDHRLRIAQNLPANQQAGDGSVLTIVDQSAELWVVLPGTVIGLDPAGNLLRFGDQATTPPTGPTIVRNDINRLALIMAGVIGRYTNERARAELVIKGFVPWADLLGYILDCIQTGDDKMRIGAIITSVEWVMGSSPETRVKTGYA